MSSRLASVLRFFLDVERDERLKVLLLAIAFFLIIGGYTIMKELKDAVFINTVGFEYIKYAKMIAMFVLIPAILIYSKLVDILRRYQLLCLYILFYGIVGLICAYLLGHSVIGLSNTDISPYRIFGWFFYFFIEGYTPFVISVFWAFANSITSPEAAKNNYTTIVVGSKLGGMLMASLAWFMLNHKIGVGLFSDIAMHQFLLAVSSGMVLLTTLAIYILMTKVPGQYLHGYEAAYQFEKKRSHEEVSEKKGLLATLQSMTSGLLMLVKYPYVMGIFGMIFFWEVINTVFGYQRLGVGQAATSTMSEFSGFLFEQAFFVHLAGLLIVFFGTRTLINVLGERLSLMLVPVSTGVLMIYYLLSNSVTAVVIVYVLIRAVNYAFSWPLRESLYIITTKDTKFKSKSWIDAFGAKLARGFGSCYNYFADTLSQVMVLSAHTVFFTSIIGLWLVVAHLLGRRFEKAVKRNEVIGD
ncbi:MAG: Npt1/Npt2 family nucleotide transporter [Candidatus Babeliaceae bacterium]